MTIVIDVDLIQGSLPTSKNTDNNKAVDLVNLAFQKAFD